MPEPLTAAHDSQGASVANAPTPPAPDEPTTAPLPDPMAGFMDALDLPKEVRDRITPPPLEAEPDPIPPVETEVAPEQPEAVLEETEETDDDLEQEPPQQEGQPPKVDKRQKRINRLTRQKSELEAQLDTYSQRLQQLESQQRQSQPAIDPLQVAFSGPTPWMPDQETSESYQKVSAELSKATATIAFCNENPEGVNVTNAKGEPEFIEPERIAQWKSVAEAYVAPARAEKVVIEREAKHAFKAQKANFDAIAQQSWPEMFDPRTPEHQEMQGLLRAYPWLNGMPNSAMAVGLIIEGNKSWQSRLTKNGNGNGNGQQAPPVHRDLDPRVLGTPRVPLAPHTAEPSGRETQRSSQQQFNDAMAKHVADPDGNHLVDAFNALEAQKRATVTSRSPVKK